MEFDGKPWEFNHQTCGFFMGFDGDKEKAQRQQGTRWKKTRRERDLGCL